MKKGRSEWRCLRKGFLNKLGVPVQNCLDIFQNYLPESEKKEEPQEALAFPTSNILKHFQPDFRQFS